MVIALLAVLTGVGARRRGSSRWQAAVSAAGFPLTWIAWYVRDELLKRPRGAERTVLAP
ncbi:MAG TPA: hypothetical protein VFE40_10040 [Jatrophihabitantaceae bacterium]|nr:hypothetical protein [Jatrophihabitantaceae bacterium]